MAEENEVLTFTCAVVTPTRAVAKVDKVVNAEFMAEDGEYEVQPRHEPSLVPLKIGLLKLSVLQPTGETKEESLVINGGFLDIDGEQATVFAYSAERGGEIDLKRAKESEKRARERLDVLEDNASYSNIDVARAERALARSIARQQAGANRAI